MACRWVFIGKPIGKPKSVLEPADPYFDTYHAKRSRRNPLAKGLGDSTLDNPCLSMFNPLLWMDRIHLTPVGGGCIWIIVHRAEKHTKHRKLKNSQTELLNHTKHRLGRIMGRDRAASTLLPSLVRPSWIQECGLAPASLGAVRVVKVQETEMSNLNQAKNISRKPETGPAACGFHSSRYLGGGETKEAVEERKQHTSKPHSEHDTKRVYQTVYSKPCKPKKRYWKWGAGYANTRLSRDPWTTLVFRPSTQSKTARSPFRSIHGCVFV